MMKIKIEGIELHYKNVTDLNTRVHENLIEVRSKRQETATQLKALTKKERALTKFLGIQGQEKSPEVTRVPLVLG